MNHEYILRLYDTDMLAFTLTEQGIEGLKAHILWSNKEKRHLLPMDMQETDAGVLKRLQKRVIPQNRTYVSEILKTFGLFRIVDETPFISNLQRQFYKTMLQTRKERILDFSMEKLLK